MRFTSLIAVSSLVITLGVFQVSAIQDDASLATVEKNTPMIQLTRRADPTEAEGATAADTEGKEAGSAEEAANVEIAEVKEIPEVQLAEKPGEESNGNEGSAGDRKKAKEASASVEENVQAAAVPHKAGKHKGAKKHAKAAGSGGGAHKSSKHAGASKASRTGPKESRGRVMEASMESMDADMAGFEEAVAADMGEMDRPRRSRQAQRASRGGSRRGSRRGRKIRGGRGSMRNFDNQGMDMAGTTAPAKKKGGLGGGLPIISGLLGGI